MDATVSSAAAVESQATAAHVDPYASATWTPDDATPLVDAPSISGETASKVTVFLSLAQRVRRLKVVFVLIFLLGAGSAAAAPNVPNLIVKAFGGNSYLVSGLFSGAKGLLACFYAPAVGALSDGRSRRWALLIAFTCALFSPVTYIATQNYWAYAAVDTVFGVYGPILSLLMTCVTDYIPASCPARTESFAMTMFFFLLGVGLGPMAAMALDAYMSFVMAAALTLLSVVVTFFLLPAAERFRAEDEAIAREYMAAAAAGRCPVLPATRLPGMSHPPVHNPHDARDAADTTMEASATAAPAAGKCPFHHGHAAATAAVTVQNDGPAAPGAAAATLFPDAEGTAPEGTAAGDDAQAPEEPKKGACESARDAAVRMRTVFMEYRSLRLVLAIVFWSCMCQEALESSLTLYLKHRVGFTSSDFAPFIAVVALNGLVSLGLVVPSLRRCFGTITTLKIAIGGNILFALGLAFLYAKWQAYAVTAFGMLGYGVFPCSSSLVAHSVPQHSAGAAQGILTAMRMLAQGIGPAVFGFVFHVSQHTDMPGAPYLIGAACGVIALATGIIVSRMVSLP